MPSVRRAALTEDLRMTLLQKFQRRLACTRTVKGDHEDDNTAAHLHDGPAQIAEEELCVFNFASCVCLLCEKVSMAGVEDGVKVVTGEVTIAVRAECALSWYSV